MALVCASCGAEHAPGARFCSECGAPLQRTCPACGFEQPAGATFCSNCGIALRDDARRAGEASDDRQERRGVTRLFADLARSARHAEPGEVLGGQRTQAATSRTITYREHEALEAKGKSEPVPTWVAVAVTGDQEPATRGIAGLSAPLVGRNDELAILSAVAARVERERAPQLVTLFGPAGVGKSRLLAELVERLPDARLVKGRCLPYGEGITFWPLAEAAKAHAGILDTDPAEVALSKLRAAIESVG